MKLVTSLLLGSAAGFAAVAGAQAADLPAKKAAPVEYVRVCSTYGEGFFFIPGTETCLRVSGRVRADYLYNSPLTRAADATGFRARGRLQLDARTSTAYGLLRSVVRFEITRSSGTPFGRERSIGTTPDINEAFIQFGGLTAGRVTSFFSNGDLPTTHMGTLRFDDAPDVNLLAYTFTFGNGFSASVSLEDGIDRRYNDPFFGGAAIGLDPAGQRLPDVVANVKYTGTWGTAQLSGAVHQLRSNNLFTSAVGFSNFPDTEYGIAVGAQVGINLPQLGTGDTLWFSAQYSNGALGYLSGGNDVLNTSPNTNVGSVLGFTDGYINPITGDIERGKGWSLAGGLQHYWTPEIRSSIFGSFLSVSYGGPSTSYTTDGFVTGLADFKEWRVGGNVFWQPVTGLDFGVEAIYVKLDPKGRIFIPGAGSFGDDSAWEGRLRVQRDF